MPGYIIHMVEAKMICDILLRDSQSADQIGEQWQEEFLFGSLLPDAGGKLQKRSSHFWNESEKDKVIMTPDLNSFLQKYAGILNQSPLYAGYFAHLHLDHEFWSGYISGQVEFLDNDGKITEHMKNLKSVWIRKTEKIIPAGDFFSQDYLYGDYTRLNKILAQKYDLKIPVYREYHNCKIEEADSRDMIRLLENLKTYMNNSLACTGDTSVLSLETLETFLKKTAQQFAEWYSTYLVKG